MFVLRRLICVHRSKQHGLLSKALCLLGNLDHYATTTTGKVIRKANGNHIKSKRHVNVKPQRPSGGGRFLTDPEQVFQHNNWDDVTWDEEQEQEAKAKVDKNSQKKVSNEMKEKYEQEADTFWDKFYSQHQNKFFKDRHWLFTEFPELAGKNYIPPEVPQRAAPNSDDNQQMTAPDENSKSSEASNSQRTSGEPLNVEAQSVDSKSKDESDSKLLDSKVEIDSSRTAAAKCEHSSVDSKEGESLNCEAGSFPGAEASMRILEVGCGVGNTVFPVLQTNDDPGLFVYGCDLSSTAIQILQEHPDYDRKRCHAFVCDVTDPDQNIPFPESSLDLVVLIFVLSAIHPDSMQRTIDRLASFLKPGGLMVFRDYGRYDLAQLRFKDGQCLEENFYVRGDGTRVYFFTQEELRDMFVKAGLVEEQNTIDRRLQVNRSRQLKMYRVWVQCKYRKPAGES